MERRLAAIFAADVVGYSKLMGADEESTLAKLQAHRSGLFDPKIAEHKGRIIKLMGDGTLVEFASVVDAVNCAFAIQSALSEPDSPIRLRIGINLGDVIVDGDDIYGDGVNIAARLEALAEPGGICISSIVHESLGNRTEVKFTDAGEHQVKNIARPIRVFSWPSKIAVSAMPTAKSMDSTEFPSIAVLPFDNMSGDADQEFFADGLTEDIITALSRNSWYDVKARNSTFAYKGTSPDVREVARALGANYVLEGSVRKGGNRARITAQLIEAVTGNHVWADRYDRELDDEFAVQDEIAQKISSILSERIWQNIARHIGNKRLEEYSAWDYTYAAIELVHRVEPASTAVAQGYLEKALVMSPDLYMAHLGLGFCHMFDFLFWGEPNGTALDMADRHAQRLLEIGPDNAQTYRLLARLQMARHKFAEAWQCVERALKIDPNDGDVIASRGQYHLYSGEFETAIEWFDKVLALHDDTPHTVDIMRLYKAVACFSLADYRASADMIERVSGLEFIKHLWLSACHTRLNEIEQARQHARAVLRIRPQFRISNIGFWKNYRNESDRQHLYNALKDAGLPE